MARFSVRRRQSVAFCTQNVVPGIDFTDDPLLQGRNFSYLGIKAGDGAWHEADEKLEGGPSVLFDAVVLLPSDDILAELVMRPAARDFVADAFAHRKFIGYTESAKPLLQKAGVPDKLDEGLILLKATGDCEGFVTRCRQLRF